MHITIINCIVHSVQRALTAGAEPMPRSALSLDKTDRLEDANG